MRLGCRGCVVGTLEGPGITSSQCPTCARPAWKRDLAPNHKYQALVEQLQGLARALQQEEAAALHQPPADQQGQPQQGSPPVAQREEQVRVGAAARQEVAPGCLHHRQQTSQHQEEEQQQQQGQQQEQQQPQQQEQEQEPSQVVVVPDSEAVGTAPTVAGSWAPSTRPSSAAAGSHPDIGPCQQQQAAASQQRCAGAGTRRAGLGDSWPDLVGGALGPASAAQQPDAMAGEAAEDLQHHLGAAGAAATLPELLTATGLLQPAASPAAAWWLHPVAEAALMQAAADLPPPQPQEVAQVAAHLATIHAALADVEALLAEAMAAAMGQPAAQAKDGVAGAARAGCSAVSGPHQRSGCSKGSLDGLRPPAHHGQRQPTAVAQQVASEQVLEQQQQDSQPQQQQQQQQAATAVSPEGSHSSGPLAFKCKRRRAAGQGPRRLALQEEDDDEAAQQQQQEQQEGHRKADGATGGADSRSCPHNPPGQMLKVASTEGLQRAPSQTQSPAAAAAAAGGVGTVAGDDGSPPAKRTRRRGVPMQVRACHGPC
jgi:hypothetical protein